MQILGMTAVLVVLFIAYGTRTMSMKFAQSGRVYTLKQALVYTTLYSALQAAVLLAVPPYPSLICDAEFFIYPLGFAVFYMLGYIFLMMSISCGSAAISNTVNSFNTLIPVFFGVIFWNESLSVFKILGLAFFVAGLVIYNKSSYSVDGVKKRFTLRWLMYAMLSMFSVGIAVIFTKAGMANYPQYGEAYLIYYALFSTVCGSIAIVLFARDEFKKLIWQGKFIFHTGVAATAFNVSNYIFVNLINKFEGVFFLPLCSVMGMFANLTFGRVFLKEKISRGAILSSVICIAAIVLLNF